MVRPRDPWAEGPGVGGLEEELLGSLDAPGKVVEAAGGTLLVDEITRLSPIAQAKLLGAAEGRSVFAGNDASSEPIDFRLIATSRFDPAESVRRGALREDLHYRIGVVAIRVPPLRKRTEDLPDLIRALLAELCAKSGKAVPSVEPEFVQLAVEYSWPGNVTQLRDCLEAMMRAGDVPALSADRLRTELAEIGEGRHELPPSHALAPLARLERAAVLHALEVHEGNRTQAARSLGISVRTLQRKLRRWHA